MPILFVYGVRLTSKKMDALYNNLRASVEAIPELDLTRDDVSVHFIETMFVGNEKAITVMVEGLFEKLPRTHEVRTRLADRIRDIILEAHKTYVKGAIHVIEVPVKRFDPDKDGFSVHRFDEPSEKKVDEDEVQLISEPGVTIHAKPLDPPRPSSP